jgi:hypothetical protein
MLTYSKPLVSLDDMMEVKSVMGRRHVEHARFSCFAFCMYLRIFMNRHGGHKMALPDYRPNHHPQFDAATSIRYAQPGFELIVIYITNFAYQML